MVYKNDIGYSNIRIPNEKAHLLYKYSGFNTFPEEVFVHEFLHNLERVEQDYGNEVPELHDYEKYGYTESVTDGLKKWYKDYMMGNITDEKLGLTEEAFINKPVQDSCFENTVDLTEEFFYEPEDFVGKIKVLIEKIKEEYKNIEGDYNEYIRV